jgi:gliding motility-associated-like protein
LKKVVYLIAALWLLPLLSHATHIVGGDMTYRFIERVGESNRYMFKIKIYYDCYPADGHAAIASDSTITVAVYQQMTVSPELWRLTGNNGGLRMLTIRRGPLVTIPNPVFECIVPPANICVYESVFEFELLLKRIPMPYCISYQRCCRNQALIANLPTNEANMGSNYHVMLTPQAQLANNTSPTFSNYPNTTICLGDPLDYNHEATDLEGDSLVYKFCQPTTSPGQAGNPNFCFASPAANPVGNWNCPPPIRYAQSYPQYPWHQPMAGDPVVAMDSVTGRIRGKPYSLGQFVVSVCVEEWRNGVLLGKVFRDFQFNVVRCPKKVEVFLNQADSTRLVGDKQFIISKCDSTTITIVNNSRQARFVNDFYWEFNIRGTRRVIRDWHPTITFPDTGYYHGMLWINKGERCYDSAYVDVMIGSGIQNNFSLKFDSCKAAPIQFYNQLINSYLPLSSVRWHFMDTLIYKNVPSITYPYQPGIRQGRLTIRNIYGCESDKILKFDYLPMPDDVALSASPIKGCLNTKVTFKSTPTLLDSLYPVKWTFGDVGSSTDRNPSHVYAQSGRYPVTMMLRNRNGCKKSYLLPNGISIHPTPSAGFDYDPKTINNAAGEVQFRDRSTADVAHWVWQFGNKGGSILENPMFLFRDTGSYKVQLTVRTEYGCTDSTYQILFVEPFSSFHLPNAFTPNFDGHNDLYKGIGFGSSQFKEFSMQIYNRWGEVVFQANAPDEGWNGRKYNTGELLPEGIYLYVVRYKNYVGKETLLNNHFSLIR